MNEQQKQDRIAELGRRLAWFAIVKDESQYRAQFSANVEGDANEYNHLTAPPAEKTEGEKIMEKRRIRGWRASTHAEIDKVDADTIADINAAIAAEVEAAIAQAREERNQREADLEHERNSRRHAEAELAKFDRHNKELRAEVKRQQAEIERLNAMIREHEDCEAKLLKRIVDLEQQPAAQRIEIQRFTCPTCGVSHNRGPINGLNSYRCLKCGETYLSQNQQSPQPAAPPVQPENIDARYNARTGALDAPILVKPVQPQGDDAPEKVADDWYPREDKRHAMLLEELHQQREAGRREAQAVELPKGYGIACGRSSGKYYGVANVEWRPNFAKRLSFAAALADVKQHAGKGGVK